MRSLEVCRTMCVLGVLGCTHTLVFFRSAVVPRVPDAEFCHTIVEGWE